MKLRRRVIFIAVSGGRSPELSRSAAAARCIAQAVALVRGGEAAGLQVVEHGVAHPLEHAQLPRQGGLFVAQEQVGGQVGVGQCLGFVVDDLERRFVGDLEPLLIDLQLYRVHLRVHRAPRPDGGLGAVGQRQCDLDDRFDPFAGIRLRADDVDDADRTVLPPVGDQLAGVGGPAGEVVVERAGRDAQTAAHLREFEPAVPEVGEDVQARLEV